MSQIELACKLKLTPEENEKLDEQKAPITNSHQV